MATAAALGLSSFLSYQCAAAVKADFSAVTAATIAVAAITAAVTTPAVAKIKKSKKSLHLQRLFCIIGLLRSKIFL